ncbi:MAG: ATP-binding protein [Acidobacteriota bacterium]
MKRRILLSWSSGKDSAWALHCLRQDDSLEVAGLLTTVNAEYERISMHGVRNALLQIQAEAVGVPLEKITIPHPCPNSIYERLMGEAIDRARVQGIEAVAFGDLFLEDVRAYRERMMEGTGLEPLFPIWGIPTSELARTMVASGQRAILTCVDPRQCSPRFLGRTFDDDLLDELPETVDPCAENGEFHTFATQGPAFRKRVETTIGERVEREGFHFIDLLPAPAD